MINWLCGDKNKPFLFLCVFCFGILALFAIAIFVSDYMGWSELKLEQMRL